MARSVPQGPRGRACAGLSRHHSAAPVHILVIPKDLVSWDDFAARASEAEIAGSSAPWGMSRANTGCRARYRLLANVGGMAGRRCPHLHVSPVRRAAARTDAGALSVWARRLASLLVGSPRKSEEGLGQPPQQGDGDDFRARKASRAILATAEKKSLHRSLGGQSSLSFGVGCIIGTGIFAADLGGAQKKRVPAFSSAYHRRGGLHRRRRSAMPRSPRWSRSQGSAYTYS